MGFHTAGRKKEFVGAKEVGESYKNSIFSLIRFVDYYLHHNIAAPVAMNHVSIIESFYILRFTRERHHADKPNDELIGLLSHIEIVK